MDAGLGMLDEEFPHPARTGVPMARICKFGSINMLTAGLFDGFASMERVAGVGDLGLGTFEGLDGEMVMLDGDGYRIGIDGVARRVDPAATTPFAVAGAFEDPISFDIEACADWASLVTVLDRRLANPNRPTMIRIDGHFTRVRARSVPGQEKPYPSLGRVAEGQVVFDLPAFSGTMVGFRFPRYLQAIDVAGYHLHVIDDERRCGGHVLDVRLDRATASIESAGGFEMILPDDDAFRKAQLVDDPHAEVQRAERG